MQESSEFSEAQFISHFLQNAPQIMWFLGAGVPRTAGMPTATDLLWDLKRKYYCLKENQDLQSHDLNNNAIKKKIQDYLDSKQFPAPWSSEEYSFYFQLAFGTDYAAQQKYLADNLSSKNISLNVGHRVLAALVEMGFTRIIFTTNFDEVIENAYSAVTGKNLSSFNLEGSYAALEALNSEAFPIYAKIHGDFKYQSIKNLSADLLNNDKEIQKCFLAASNRYGLVVTGYSGRDANVMSMFDLALQQNNPFPHGLFWTVPKIISVPASVKTLIAAAKAKGVRACVIETGTFDIMMSKIWRQLPNKNEALDIKVRTAKAKKVSISLPQAGANYPLLRTNALAIVGWPNQCGSIDYNGVLSFQELNDKDWALRPSVVWSFTDRILFWGDSSEIKKMVDPSKIRTVKAFDLVNEGNPIRQSTILRSFYEQALATALCDKKPLLLRRKGKSYYIVVDHEFLNDPILQPLKDVVGYQSTPGPLNGQATGQANTFWAEALSIKLELKGDSLWLLMEPDIWISPLANRETSTDFLRSKKLRRYNKQAYQILSAWIKILFGSVGQGQEVTVKCYPASEFVPTFTISTRTAYSCEGSQNG